MAGIITLSAKSTISTVRDDFRYTAARLKKHKLTATSLAPEFMAFEPTLKAAEDEEEGLRTEEEECDAAVEFLGVALDAVVDKVTGVTGNTRGTPEYNELFGSQQVYEFKRPTLEGQLEPMANWEVVLADKTNSILVEVRAELKTLIPEAQTAQARKKAVEKRYKVFRETGTRAQLISEFNALRKSIYGKLSDLQHKHKLGAGWAESFFRRSSSQTMNLREVDRRIAATRAQLTELESTRAEILKKQADEAEAARIAEEKAKQAEIAAKRALIAKLQADVAALEDEPQE